MVSVIEPLLANAKTYGTAPIWFPGRAAYVLWEMESVFQAFAIMFRGVAWWGP